MNDEALTCDVELLYSTGRLLTVMNDAKIRLSEPAIMRGAMRLGKCTEPASGILRAHTTVLSLIEDRRLPIRANARSQVS